MPAVTVSPRDVAAAVRAQRARTLAFLEDLPAAAWETVVTPGWRVREVAAHLITTDAGALTGRMLRLGLRPVPMEAIEAWNDEQVARWADRPVPALLHALDRWGRRLARVVRVPPGPVARGAIVTPLGKVSLLWLAGLRVYDEWVHLEDLRRALGAPLDDHDDTVAAAARQLLDTIPVQTLPRVPARARGAVTLRIRDVPLPPFTVDLDRRRYGTALPEAGTTVEALASPLIMVAARRDAWRDAEARGAIVVSGLRAPAETFLDALLAV